MSKQSTLFSLRHPSQGYQPKTGQACTCRPGIERDNCPACEGTGRQIDFRAIRERTTNQPTTLDISPL